MTETLHNICRFKRFNINYCNQHKHDFTALLYIYLSIEYATNEAEKFIKMSSRDKGFHVRPLAVQSVSISPLTVRIVERVERIRKNVLIAPIRSPKFCVVQVEVT